MQGVHGWTKIAATLQHFSAKPTAESVPHWNQVAVNGDFLYLNKLRVGKVGIQHSIQPTDCGRHIKQDGLNAEMRFQAWVKKTWPDALVFTANGMDNMREHWEW